MKKSFALAVAVLVVGGFLTGCSSEDVKKAEKKVAEVATEVEHEVEAAVEKGVEKVKEGAQVVTEKLSEGAHQVTDAVQGAMNPTTPNPTTP